MKIDITKYNKPGSFYDILVLQKVLDENIKNERERTEEDIELSIIAELIEFNEETPESHKTWKSKEISREKMLEELTDVYFFFAQLLNFQPILEVQGYNLEKSFRENTFDNSTTTKDVISELMISSYDYEEILESLNNLRDNYGFKADDILKEYWRKWKKNIERIGNEWN